MTEGRMTEEAASERDRQDADHWRRQAELWQRKAREHKAHAYTWRRLYHDLLTEISDRLDRIEEREDNL